ncbi:Na+/H+ antiporter subunit E [Advenella alkanexedens]|uniref:Na+/H+ antiporter subunit E n=2 Tax=Alcaligenaceae TaxID=506 RepID=A0ABS6NNR0_9BURK|nr:MULTISPECIES: Na+/H+ antiporter subunit E [Advenella]MBV4397269.1 Na+/H+ antiporter subunit E [Advenella alkanexedens]NLN67240.1 Na+/H+ antiporter subunit E [Alcaligenaceae bacterium]NLY34402.1 Na+/H+ antiporter subunit E [Alcaligenaceae bacterium]
MRKFFFWFPMSAFLLLIWMLLANALTIGQFVLGSILSLGLVLASQRLRPLHGHPKKTLTILKLICLVIVDIAYSNWVVGILILKGKSAHRTPGFINIPLDIRDPHGLAILSCIITYTPGTVWSGLTEDDFILRLHVLNLKEESDWIHTIKNRYEANLIEIFE